MLEVLERKARQNSLWKIPPQTGEARNNRVELCTQLGFWDFNQEGVIARMQASWNRYGGSEARKHISDIGEETIKKEGPRTYLLCESNRTCASA